MEQWQINTLNKCAKDGNLPKGIPFIKEQIIAMLGINPAEFILLQKENFIARTAPDAADFTTTERWEKLKAAGSCDALLTAENKDKPALVQPVAPVLAKPAANTEKTVTTEQPKPANQPPVAVAPKPQESTPKAAAPSKEAATHTTTPVKEKTTPTAPYTPSAKGTEKEGMDLTSIISLIGVAIGVLIIIFSVMKK